MTSHIFILEILCFGSYQRMSLKSGKAKAVTVINNSGRQKNEKENHQKGLALVLVIIGQFV